MRSALSTYSREPDGNRRLLTLLEHMSDRKVLQAVRALKIAMCTGSFGVDYPLGNSACQRVLRTYKQLATTRTVHGQSETEGRSGGSLVEGEGRSSLLVEQHKGAGQVHRSTWCRV